MGAGDTGNRRTTLVVLSLILLGCSKSTTDLSEYSGFTLLGNTIFISRPEVNAGNMEAVYHGLVVKDDKGCLRLQPGMDGTVVWPHGFSLQARDKGQWVIDRKGKTVGAVNGRFRFGGGFVPALQSSLGFGEADISKIQDRCPGRFWIVGEILTP
jgi:hypothetical protein